MAETDIPIRGLRISAFGINSGGGLVLLKALLEGASGDLRSIEIDARVSASQVGVPEGTPTRSVRRSFAARMLSSLRAAREGREDEVLLCFNSLPPLTRSRARVVTYVHAPHFVGAHAGIRYTPVTRLRIVLERAWFRFAIGHSDEVWVQTPTMAHSFHRLYPTVTVRVVPLLDGALHRMVSSMDGGSPAAPHAWQDKVFFYPADTVGHKNHVNLLRAWALLHDAGHDAQLWLTLDHDELDAMLAAAGVPRERAGAVRALGRLSRDDVLARLSASSALIFPSIAETFGLPMLEASALNKPVLAAERDFVRDVCRPAQTFDPTSPYSIAHAVTRFVEGEGPLPGPFFSAAAFREKLLS